MSSGTKLEEARHAGLHACSLIPPAPREMQDFVVMLPLEFGCTPDFAENLMYMSLLIVIQMLGVMYIFLE